MYACFMKKYWIFYVKYEKMYRMIYPYRISYEIQM